MTLCALTPRISLRAQGTGQNVIHGSVTGPDGRPVEAEVKLREVTRNVVNSAYSNSNGEFTFQGVGDGRYYVTVESDLYQRAEVATHVAWTIAPWANINIMLKALPTAPRNQPNGIRSASQLASLAELKTTFPKKAVKEYDKGNKQLKHGEVEAAIVSYSQALMVAPAMYPALNNLGNAYFQAKQLSKAEAVFRQAMSANPLGAEPYINLGHLYYVSNRYLDAEAYLLKGLERFPNSALGHFLLGSTYARLGKLEAAEINLRKALDQNDPAVSVAHLELANIYLRTNRQRNAGEQLEAFLKEQPQNPQAEHIRRTLRRLKDQPERVR